MATPFNVLPVAHISLHVHRHRNGGADILPEFSVDNKLYVIFMHFVQKLIKPRYIEYILARLNTLDEKE